MMEALVNAKEVLALVYELEREYGGDFEIPDGDARIVAVRRWFNSDFTSSKLNKVYSYDADVIKYYELGYSDREIAKKINRSEPVVFRSRQRLQLGKPNTKKQIYKLTNLESGEAKILYTTNEVGELLATNQHNFAYLVKRATRMGYKLERGDDNI